MILVQNSLTQSWDKTAWTHWANSFWRARLGVSNHQSTSTHSDYPIQNMD